MQAERRSRTFEQNIITVMTGITVAILVWIGSSIITVGKAVEKLEVQMANLADKFATQEQIVSLRLEVQKVKDEQDRRRLFIPGYGSPLDKERDAATRSHR